MRFKKTLKQDASLNLWEKISHWLTYGAVFITPLLVLPWSNFPLTLTKQTFFIGIVFLAVIFWLIGGLIRGQIIYKKNLLNQIILILVIFTFISALLSGSLRLGFFGSNGSEVDTLINVTAFGLFYFVISATTRSFKDIKNIIFTLLISSLLVAIYALLQIFGIWILPMSFTKITAFNTIGTVNSLSIFSGGALIIALGLLYLKPFDISLRLKIFLLTIIFIFFALLFAVNFWPVFLGILIALLLIIFYQFQNNNGSKKPIGLFILVGLSLIIIIARLGIIPIKLPVAVLPPEALPSLGTTLNIAGQTLTSGVKNFIFGSGPASFSSQYLLFRDPLINLTPFWEVKFNQGANAFLTHLVNGGVFGFLIWFSFFAFLIFLAVKDKGKEAAFLNVGLTYLVIMLLFYPQNFSVYFLIFLLAGLIAYRNINDFSLINPPQRAFIMYLVFICFIVSLITALYLQGQHYVAAAFYYQPAVEVAEKAESIDSVLDQFIQASRLDAGNDIYLQTLVSAYLYKIQELLDKNLPEAQLQESFTDYLDTAIKTARAAVSANKLNSENILSLGQIYEELIILVEGAAEQAVANYEQAALLDPQNPVIPFKIGRSYFNEAGRLIKNNPAAAVADYYQKSLASLEQSIVLKPDYAPSHLLMIRTLDRLNRSAEALDKAEQLKRLLPNNVDILLSLGFIHYQVGRFIEAEKEFSSVLVLAPENQDAQNYLNLIHNQQN